MSSSGGSPLQWTKLLCCGSPPDVIGVPVQFSGVRSRSTRTRRFVAVSAAVVGLVGPRQASAVELNLGGIDQYTPKDQVTSIAQFSDLQPTDWAYQALIDLVDRYGCVSGYPNGTYLGATALTRFEAAALLNACLDRAVETTDTLQHLINEFQAELKILKGRVDGLATKVGELEANQFSTTTKLSGQATFVLGANAFSGSATALKDASRANFGATTFNYDLLLTFDTSFVGRDLLRTTLRAGNFEVLSNSFGGAGPSNLSQLEVAFQEEFGVADVGIDRLYYQFPVGRSLTLTVGGRVAQEDMLAFWPSVYPDVTVLDVLAVNGASAAYNKNLGPGAGLWWRDDSGLSISGSYVAANGFVGNPAEGGLATQGSAGTGTLQIAYAKPQWAVAAIWSYLQNGNDVAAYYGSTFTAEQFVQPGQTNAFALSGYWQPKVANWIPSISAGWGINTASYEAGDSPGSVRVSQSWSVGLQWLDAFAKGNAAGFAFGQPIFATSLYGGEIPADGNFVWEWWFNFQLTDSISLTPALFYLSRPLGQDTPANQSLTQLGGLVKSTFRF